MTRYRRRLSWIEVAAFAVMSGSIIWLSVPWASRHHWHVWDRGGSLSEFVSQVGVPLGWILFAAAAASLAVLCISPLIPNRPARRKGDSR